MSQISYKDAGVDIDAGNSFVDNIKPIVKSTFTPHVLGGIGSFAGAYELPTGYKQPVMLGNTHDIGRSRHTNNLLSRDICRNQ